MHSLNNVITEVRIVIARAGEADRLNWWPSKAYSSGAKVLERLFPKTASKAAYEIISHAARQKDGTLEQQTALLSLFYLGGKREALLSYGDTRPPEVLLNQPFQDGDELSRALLDHYTDVLGSVDRVDIDACEVNLAQKRVDVMAVESADLREGDLRRVVALLIASLQYSDSGNYLPPVVRISEHTP